MRTAGFFILSFLTLFLAQSCNQGSASDQPEKLNFVVVYSDEMDPGYLEPYNPQTIYKTPNISKLADDGAVFTNAYTTSPMCTPSRFSMITGKFAGRCTASDFIADYPYHQPYSVAWNTHIDESMKTIADYIRMEGYVSGMSGKWHVGSMERGPDVPWFEKDEDPEDPDVNARLQKLQAHYKEILKKTAGFDEANSVLWGNFDGFPLRKLAEHNIPWITYGAVKFIEKRADDGKPFFLYVTPTAIHGPGHAKELDLDPAYTIEGFMPEVREYNLDTEKVKEEMQSLPGHARHKYVGLAYTDHLMANITGSLEEAGLMDNTVIIFIADHNVEPGKATCYEQGNKVPLIVKWPGKPAQVVRDAFVQNIDLTATILKSAGVENISELGLDGVDMEPLLSDGDIEVRGTIFTESGYARTVRKGQYKYIAFRPTEKMLSAMKSPDAKFAPNYLDTPKQAHSQIAMQYFPHYFDQDQLYDLEADPYEQNNLAGDPAYASVMKEMRGALKEYTDSFRHPYDLAEIPFMNTDRYRELSENTRNIGTDFISWFSRDHGVMVYPPKD